MERRTSGEIDWTPHPLLKGYNPNQTALFQHVHQVVFPVQKTLLAWGHEQERVPGLLGLALGGVGKAPRLGLEPLNQRGDNKKTIEFTKEIHLD